MIVYNSPSVIGWRYYFTSFNGNDYEVSEEEFFELVGYNRRLIPMHYDEHNINRQNFYLYPDRTCLLGFRIRR